MDTMSKKAAQWRQFSRLVEKHIEEYVVPQYGDLPDKTVAKWTPEKIQGKLESYIDRIGKSSRGPEDQIRDALKIAHFASYLYSLYVFNDAQLS